MGADERARVFSGFDGSGLAGSSAGTSPYVSNADANWILGNNTSANPYANLSMNGGGQVRV